jgi:hypothetical protein
MVTKNKNINITPSKGISIVIKNDFQPDVKPKKKRKYKKRIIPKANPQSSFHHICLLLLVVEVVLMFHTSNHNII